MAFVIVDKKDQAKSVRLKLQKGKGIIYRIIFLRRRGEGI